MYIMYMCVFTCVRTHPRTRRKGFYMTRCAEWLKGYLSSDMSEVNATRSDALKAGFSKAELKEARKELGVKTFHQFDLTAEPRVENWFWYLPEDVS